MENFQTKKLCVNWSSIKAYIKWIEWEFAGVRPDIAVGAQTAFTKHLLIKYTYNSFIILKKS